jgi:hypothetical protein
MFCRLLLDDSVMMRTCGFRLLLGFVSLTLLLLAGCGGGKPRTVSGKLVLLPGTNLVASDSVNLIFVPEAQGGKTVVADVSQNDLTFTAKVPPGKYKISFSVQPYAGESESEKRAEAFAQTNEAFSTDSTPLTYEVTGDPSQTVTVDLAQRRVAKN